MTDRLAQFSPRTVHFAFIEMKQLKRHIYIYIYISKSLPCVCDQASDSQSRELFWALKLVHIHKSLWRATSTPADLDAGDEINPSL